MLHSLGREKYPETLWDEVSHRYLDPIPVAELKMIMEMVEDFNKKVENEARRLFAKLRAEIKNINERKVVFLPDNEYEKVITPVKSTYLKLDTITSFFNPDLMNMCKDIPAFEKWAPRIPWIATPVYKVYSKEVKKIRKQALDFYKRYWEPKEKWMKSLRFKLAQKSAAVFDVKVNGKNVRYATDAIPGKIKISGKVSFGLPVEGVRISGDVKGIAEMEKPKCDEDGCVAKWSYTFEAKPGSYNISIMPFGGHAPSYTGPGIVIYVKKMGKKEYVDMVRRLYREFAYYYSTKNLSGLMSLISDSWSAFDGSTIDDIEETLENSFDAFDRIEYHISDLRITPLGNGEFKVHYKNTIKGYIYSQRITHTESSSVVEIVKLIGGEPKIFRTIQGKFWR